MNYLVPYLMRFTLYSRIFRTYDSSHHYGGRKPDKNAGGNPTTSPQTAGKPSLVWPEMSTSNQIVDRKRSSYSTPEIHKEPVSQIIQQGVYCP